MVAFSKKEEVIFRIVLKVGGQSIIKVRGPR
jgi:hypothetical protein